MNLRGFWLSRSLSLILVAGSVLNHFSGSDLAAASIFRGRTEDLQTERPVKRVQLEVRDALDGSLVSHAESDPLGFFTVRGLEPNRDFELHAVHPAYQLEVVEFHTEALDQFQTIRLTPHGTPGLEYFDITVQIVCAVSGYPVDRAPVTLRRYAEEMGGGAEAEVVRTQNTGKAGATIFTGLLPGYYEFEINSAASVSHREFYETYPSAGEPVPGRVLIEKEHVTNVFLKPVPQSFGVAVWGNDPVFTDTMRENYLDEMVVEVTGVAPNDSSFVLLPARNDISRRGPAGPDGTYAQDPVIFTGLPPIAYSVRVARLGYWEEFILVIPDVDGRLPYSVDNPLVVHVSQQNNSLQVNVIVPGFREEVCEDEFMQIFPGEMPVIELSGIEGTNTSGIVRREILTDASCGILDTVEWLLPGTYRLRIDGNAPFRVFRDAYNLSYYGNIRSEVITVEVLPAMTRPFIGPGGRQTTIEVEAPLSPAQVRGTLLAAETTRAENGKPVYQPFGGQRLVFREHSVYRRGPELAEIEVVTGPDGSFYVELEPGAYGILAPDLEEFHGYEKVTTIVDSPRYPAGRQLTGHWPLVEPLPDVYSSTQHIAVSELGFGSDGFVVHSDEEVHIDLFLRKERYSFSVTGFANGVLESRYLADGITIPNYPLLNSGSVVSAMGPDGVVSAPLQSDLQTGGLIARFRAMTGAMSGVAVEDDRYDFQYEEQVFRTVDFPVPGMPPPADRALEFVAQQGSRLLIPMEDSALATFNGFGNTERVVLQAAMWNVNLQDWVRWEVYSTFFSVPGEAGYFPGRGPIGSIGYVNVYGYWFAMDDGDVVEFDENAVPISPYLTESEVPKPSYNLSVTARPRDDIANTVAGVPVVHTPTGVVKTTPDALWAELTSQPTVTIAPGSNYILAGTSDPKVIFGGVTPTLGLEIVVLRGIEVDVTLMDAAYDIPIPHGWVSVHDRYGQRIDRKQADENGKAVFNAVGTLADYFAVASLPGYAPVRLPLRIEEASEGEEGSTAARFEAMLLMQPLARPTISTTGNPINRYGPFLPSVTRSGASSPVSQNYRLYTASDVLTANWTIQVDSAEIGYNLAGFDTSNDEPGESQEVFVVDPIRAVYLVDQRIFSKPGFGGGANAIEPIVIPPVDDPVATDLLLDWLLSYVPNGGDDVNYATRQKVFIRSMDTLESDPANPRRFIAKGAFKLWDLPPGDFEPAFMAISERGAVDFLKVAYTGADEAQQLTGLTLPSWLGGVLDILGVVSGVNATQAALKKYVPEGRFVPFPEFTAQIALDPVAGNPGGGFINYQYDFSVGQKVGQESSGSGILGMGPGMIGAELKSTATLIVKGRERSFSMGINGSVLKKDIIEDPLPPKMSKPNFIKLEIPQGAAEVSTNLSIGIDEAAPFDFRMQTAVGGGLAVKTTTALNNYARPIPYVGPVIGLLGDADLARLDLEMRGNGTFKETFTWETRNPHKVLGSTRPANERVARRHYLGGMEGLIEPIAPAVPTLELCASIGFGSSLILNLVDGIATAKASFDVGGDPCIGVGEFSGVKITVNPVGSWPLIKRVQGKATVAADLEYNVGMVKPAVSWKFDLIEFDVQYGTETTIQHIPVTVTYTNGGYDMLGRGEYNGAGPSVISQAPAGGGVFAPTKGGEAIEFVRYDPTADRVRLYFAPGTGPLAWGNGEPLVEAGHIAGAASHFLDDGRLLVVWAEPLVTADPNDPLPGANLRSLLRGPDGALSPITELGFISSIPHTLELERSGDLIGLLVVEQTPSSTTTSGYQLTATIRHFEDPGFSPPAQMFLESQIQGVQLVGGGSAGANELLLLWVDSFDVMRGKTYASATGPSLLRTILPQSTGAFAGVATPAGYEIVAGKSGGVMIRYTGNIPFTLATYAGETNRVGGATSVALVPQETNGSDGYLLAWTQPSPYGREIRMLRYGEHLPFADQEPMAVTRNPRGYYDRLTFGPASATAVTLFAFYQNGLTGEWRGFLIASEGGLAANDSNENGMNDLDELRLIDVDPNDNVRGLADISPDGDFDGDSYLDRDEIVAGSDPLDPTDMPMESGVSVVHLEILNPHVTEAGQNGAFQVTRTGGFDTDIEVPTVVTGTALRDVDYELSPAAVHFQTGATVLNFTIAANADVESEGPEIIDVALAPPGDGDPYALGSVSTGRFILTDSRRDEWGFSSNPDWVATGIPDWEGDGDGDGVPLLVEYFGGLDPASSSTSPIQLSVHPGSGENVLLRFHVSVDPMATDVVWWLERVDRLTGVWGLAEDVSVTSRVMQVDGRELVTLEAGIDPGTACFYRLRVTPTK